MGDSAAWQRPAGWMARWGAGRTTRGTRSQGWERGTGYLAAPRWLYLRPQHSSPSPCFRSVGAPAGANGQERAAGGGKARRRGCAMGRGVRRGDSARCTAQVACTTGNGEMANVRLVPRTCSTWSAWPQASQPDFFRPTGDARCCWRWGAKYLRRAGTCPSCLARCDASVEARCSHPLSAHDCEQVASWEAVGWRWRNGEGSSCSSFFAFFSPSFFVETVSLHRAVCL